LPRARSVARSRRRLHLALRAERRHLAGVQRRRFVDLRGWRPDRAAVAARPRVRRLDQEWSQMSVRMLPVPDGLDGMRVDAGLAKLPGLSRTVIAELAESGDVLVDGRPAGKSDRLAAGGVLEVTLPEPDNPAEVVAEPVEGLRILHDDDDIVVVDKPV